MEYSADDFNWDTESDSCSVGPHRFSKSENESKLVYSIVLNDVLPSGHSIKAELEFNSSIITEPTIDSKPERASFLEFDSAKSRSIGDN